MGLVDIWKRTEKWTLLLSDYPHHPVSSQAGCFVNALTQKETFFLDLSSFLALFFQSHHFFSLANHSGTETAHQDSARTDCECECWDNTDLTLASTALQCRQKRIVLTSVTLLPSACQEGKDKVFLLDKLQTIQKQRREMASYIPQVRVSHVFCLV